MFLPQTLSISLALWLNYLEMMVGWIKVKWKGSDLMLYNGENILQPLWAYENCTELEKKKWKFFLLETRGSGLTAKIPKLGRQISVTFYYLLSGIIFYDLENHKHPDSPADVTSV